MSAGKRSGTRQNVRVICRIRPTNQKEISSGGYACVKNTETAIEVGTEDGSANFNFDRIFGPESTQIEVFEYAAVPLIHDVLSGYNATIFAYGQTGTGKTHTMEGDIHNEAVKGIIPRSVGALFNAVLEADQNIEFTFKVSYVEIYMEKVRDLLDNSRLKTNLTIREDKIKGIYIAGVTEIYVTSQDELLNIMGTGATNRAVAATGMNEGSSRSHSVFTITVNQRNLTNNTTTSGKLVLVDLAGSEMVRKSNASGQQLEEAKTINKSLSSLGQVINALTDEKQTHVPYRDSKLTRILQDSLGGNAKTVLIIAVSPSSYNAPETISTLRFGTRAKSIENKVTVNQTRSVEELEALLVRAEKAIDIQASHITTLMAQIEALQYTNGINPSTGGGSNNSSGATSLGTDMTDSAAYNDHLNKAISAAMKVSEAKLNEAEMLIQSLQDNIAALTSELDEEKLESTRKDNEILEYNNRIQEKDTHMLELSNVLQETSIQYSNYKEKNEILIKEKNELKSQLNNLQTQYMTEIDTLNYEKKEYEVRLETLKSENTQLQQEINEMTGDDKPSQRLQAIHSSTTTTALHQGGGGGSSGSREGGSGMNSSVNNAMVGSSNSSSRSQPESIDNSRSNTPPRERAGVDNDSVLHSLSQDSVAASAESIDTEHHQKSGITTDHRNMPTTPGIHLGSVPSTPLPTGSTSLTIPISTEKFYEEYDILCTQHDLSTELISLSKNLITRYLDTEMKRLLIEYEDKLKYNKQLLHDYKRKYDDSYNQRNKLEKDLMDIVNKYNGLQFNMDALRGMDGIQKKDYFTTREKANNKSLQQRLEQLVVVHRQLLRKFSTMELENNEYKKKINLRDERIKQLDSNNKTMILSMKTQSEKFMNELNDLQQQIEDLRIEYTTRDPSLTNNLTNSTSGSNPANTIPNTREIRTLRGGQPSVDTSSSNNNSGTHMNITNVSLNNGSGSNVIRGKKQVTVTVPAYSPSGQQGHSYMAWNAISDPLGLNNNNSTTTIIGAGSASMPNTSRSSMHMYSTPRNDLNDINDTNISTFTTTQDINTNIRIPISTTDINTDDNNNSSSGKKNITPSNNNNNNNNNTGNSIFSRFLG